MVAQEIIGHALLNYKYVCSSDLYYHSQTIRTHILSEVVGWCELLIC
jgi:hypothetical protein